MASEKACPVGIKSAFPQAEESHQCALSSDKKLRFVGLRGVEQGKYSFYHRTGLLGSYLATLNLQTQAWEPLSHFEEIDRDENREDILLGIGENVYLLIYSRYDGFQFRKLLVWSTEKKAWEPVDSFTVDPKTKQDTGRCHLAFVQDHNSGSVFFAVSGEAGKEVIVSKMDLSSKTTSSLETGGTRPPFAFNGPSETLQLNDGRWVMVGGSLARGMANTEFSGEMWVLDLKEEDLRWNKTDTHLPPGLKGYEMCAATDGSKIYVTDRDQFAVLDL